MTEMSPASHIGRKTNASAGAAGMLLPGMRMRIVDVDGNNVRQPRLEGEICCAGPNIMKGRQSSGLSRPGAAAGANFWRRGMGRIPRKCKLRGPCGITYGTLWVRVHFAGA